MANAVAAVQVTPIEITPTIKVGSTVWARSPIEIGPAIWATPVKVSPVTRTAFIITHDRAQHTANLRQRQPSSGYAVATVEIGSATFAFKGDPLAGERPQIAADVFPLLPLLGIQSHKVALPGHIA